MMFTVGKVIRFPSVEAANRAFATGDMSEATYEDLPDVEDEGLGTVTVTAVDRGNGLVTTDSGLPSWLPDKGAAPFFGLDRTLQVERTIHRPWWRRALDAVREWIGA